MSTELVEATTAMADAFRRAGFDTRVIRAESPPCDPVAMLVILPEGSALDRFLNAAEDLFHAVDTMPDPELVSMLARASPEFRRRMERGVHALGVAQMQLVACRPKPEVQP